MLFVAPVFAACEGAKKIEHPEPDSAPLEITSLEPKSGPSGTAITIHGTGFGVEGPKNRVLVDEIAVAVTTWTDTRIVFTIPDFSGPGSLPIRVRLGRVRSNEVLFEHERPWLDSRYPSSATEGTSVSLQGVYLGSRGTLTVDGRSVPSSSWSAKHIAFFAAEPTAPVVQRVTANPSDAQPTNVLPIGRMMPVDDVPTPRGRHVAVWTGREMIIWGGYGVSRETGGPALWLRTGARYNAVTDSWIVVSPVGAPSLSEPNGVWSGKELLVWGNTEDATEGARYEPATDSWKPIAAVSLAKRTKVASAWADSEMFVWGGLDTSGEKLVRYGDGARYNPATDLWTSVAAENAPAPAEATAVWTGDEILVATGARFDGYDPVTGRWQALASPPVRIVERGIWDGSRFIAIGYDSGCPAMLFYPASNTWAVSQAANPPGCRYAFNVIAAGNEVLMVGGDRGDATSPVYSVDVYEPASDRWASQVDIPRTLSANATPVWTGSVLLLWGGIQSDSGGARTDVFATGAQLDIESAAWTPLADCANVRPSYVDGWANIWTCD